MENENTNESYQKAIERHVLKGLVSFFENANNFDNIILSARYGIEQLNKKLDNIADRLVQIDKTLNNPQTMVISVLRKVSTGAISEALGVSLLNLIEETKLRLQKERSGLELRETQLCQQINALERFEQRGLWCYLHQRQLNFDEKIDSLKAIIERVEVYVRLL